LFELAHHEFLHSFTAVKFKEIKSYVMKRFSGVYDKRTLEVLNNQLHDVLTLNFAKKVASPARFKLIKDAYINRLKKSWSVINYLEGKNVNNIDINKLHKLLNTDTNKIIISEWLTVKGENNIDFINDFLNNIENNLPKNVIGLELGEKIDQIRELSKKYVEVSDIV